ncbi:hypothetical protein C4552_04010 [Candidatus Parcubacteria bacterium]|nr:MAG: hypothetical protein C4552_04010 [Candidatus Parcubacteria bacterium]
MTQFRAGDHRLLARGPVPTVRRERLPEKLYACPLLGGGGVDRDGCLRMASDFATNLNGCAKNRCGSPWRPCIACVGDRAEHPRIASDRISGFCGPHMATGVVIIANARRRLAMPNADPTPKPAHQNGRSAPAPTGPPVPPAVTADLPANGNGSQPPAAIPPPEPNAHSSGTAHAPQAPAAPETSHGDTVAPITPSRRGTRDHDAIAVMRAILQLRAQGHSCMKIAEDRNASIGWVNQHLALRRLSPNVAALLSLMRPRGQRLGFATALQLVQFDHALQEKLAGEVLGMSFSAATRHIRQQTGRGSRVGERQSTQ